MDTALDTEFVSMPVMTVKEEPVSTETDDAAFQLNDTATTAEPDPMNLLDPVQVCETQDSEETASNEQWPSKEQWQAWMTQYPWLLHEDEDDTYGYCLYCNIKLNLRSTASSPKGHDQARNHLENKDNYLAFKENEESANFGSNTVSIKQEFGTDSDISAIKFKRMSQTEPLSNFMWRRWLESHPWLERDKDDSNFGYCKYCKLRLTVEYSYQRLRHEEGNKHRTAFWQHSNRESFTRKKGTTDEPEDQASEETESAVNENQEGSDHSSKESDAQEDTEKTTERSKRRRNIIGQYLKSPWIRWHQRSPKKCQCKICNVKMVLGNFGRHLTSKMHIDAEKKALCPKVKQEHEVITRGWKMYAKRHPWLIEDPEEPLYAYCKYCKKRLYHAMHIKKRLTHETGMAHKNAYKAYKRNVSAVKKGNTSNGGEDEESEEEAEDEEEQMEENEEDENDEAEKETESETANEENDDDNNDEGDEDDKNDEEEEDEEDKEDEEDEEDKEDEEEEEEEEEDNNVDYRALRIPKGSEQWIKRFSWCKKYKNPAYYWCTYCKKALKMSLDRKKHAATILHKEAEKKFLSKLPKNLSHFEHSQQNKRITYYPWLVYTKNNPQFVFCKYCRIRITASASRSKHEKSKRHIEAAAQLKSSDKLKKTPPKPEVAPAPALATTPTTVKSRPSAVWRARSIQTKLATWKSRFPWLINKRTETQPNYVYCKYCEMRVYCPTSKLASKHQRASKHIRARIKIKRQNTPAKQNVIVEAENTVAENTVAKNTVAEKSINYPPWVTDVEGDYGLCKYCNIRLFVTRTQLRERHQSSAKHKAAELEYLKQNSATTANASKNVESDIVVVEDDVLSVKSEPMDEDDVLEYLLQRSEKSRSSKNAHDADDSELTEPKRKRQRLSNPNLMDRAKRLTTAHLEILRLSRDLNDDANRRNVFSLPTSLLSTSAAIAALMSPPSAKAPPLTAPRNNFELFFDSVCESVKTLPSDLAAEGKIKIMQLVADLETRALQRNHSMSDLQINSTQSSTPLSFRNTSSPAVSTDVPSTTTNGLENDSTSPVAVIPPLAQYVSSQVIDNGLRLIPMTTSSHQQQRPTDNIDVNSGGVQRRIQVNTSNASDNSVRRPPMNHVTQINKKPIDASITCIPQQSASTTITYTKVPPKNTPSGFIQIGPPSSSPSSVIYQRSAQQVQQSATSYDNGGVQRIQQVQQQQNQQQQNQQQQQQRQYQQQQQLQYAQNLQKTTIIDNGIRRYQLTNKSSQPPSSPNEMTFRRIQLPLKGGATITPKSNTTASTSTPKQTYNTNI